MVETCPLEGGGRVYVKLQKLSTMKNDPMLVRYLDVQNYDGFSVDKDLNGFNPTREAYAVGGATESVECVYNDDLSFNKFKCIMDLKIKFMQEQPEDTMQVIGAWVNWAGDAFIEVSDILHDREQAIALGKERGEEAIWDFKNNREIKLT